MSVARDFAYIKEIASKGYWDDVLDIIDNNHDLVKYTDQDDVSLLIYLSEQEGSVECIKRLITMGADVNHASRDGQSALINAIEGGSTYGLTTKDILECLLQNGADTAIYDFRGNTAIQWAIQLNRLEHLEILLKHGADPYQLSKDLWPEDAFDVAKDCDNDKALELLDQYS